MVYFVLDSRTMASGMPCRSLNIYRIVGEERMVHTRGEPGRVDAPKQLPNTVLVTCGWRGPLVSCSNPHPASHMLEVCAFSVDLALQLPD